MKKLLLAVAISSALLSETALAKGKGVAGSCAQIVNQASGDTLRGAAFLLIIVLVGMWTVNAAMANRRKDKELRQFRGEDSKTGIFGHP